MNDLDVITRLVDALHDLDPVLADVERLGDDHVFHKQAARHLRALIAEIDFETKVVPDVAAP